MHSVQDSPASGFGWHRFVGSDILVDDELIANLSARFYRYTTLPELLDLLERNAITFAHPSTWSDKYEKHAIECGFGKGRPFESVRPFAKCFSSEYSSEAMWRLYAAGGPVFRYGFKLESLLEWLRCSDASALGKMYVGSVRYLKPAAIRRDRISSRPKQVSREAAQWLLKKRLGFGYEKELRATVILKKRVDSGTLTITSSSPLPILRILVDPYLPEWQYEAYRALLTDALKVPCKVEQSAFDRELEFLQLLKPARYGRPVGWVEQSDTHLQDAIKDWGVLMDREEPKFTEPAQGGTREADSAECLVVAIIA